MTKKFVRSWYGIKYDGTSYPIGVLSRVYKGLKYSERHLSESNKPLKEILINNIKSKTGKHFFRVKVVTIENYCKDLEKLMKEVAIIHSQWEQRYKREKIR